MFRYLASAYANWFKHPVLAGVGTAAVLLIGLGFVMSMVVPFTIPINSTGVPPIAAGFTAIFGILAGVIAVLGYAVLYAAKAISLVRDQNAPHAG